MVFNFPILQIPLDDPNRPESIYMYNCTKDEERGDFLQPPHKHLTPATVDVKPGHHCYVELLLSYFNSFTAKFKIVVWDYFNIQYFNIILNLRKERI